MKRLEWPTKRGLERPPTLVYIKPNVLGCWFAPFSFTMDVGSMLQRQAGIFWALQGMKNSRGHLGGFRTGSASATPQNPFPENQPATHFAYLGQLNKKHLCQL